MELNYTWRDFVSMCHQYYNEHNHLDVPFGYTTSDGFALGKMISFMRLNYIYGNLFQEEIDMLEHYHIDWMSPENHSWEYWFEECRKYFITYGNLIVNYAYKNEKGERLGEWIHYQRKLYKDNKLNPLQIKYLNSINMVWHIRKLTSISYPEKTMCYYLKQYCDYDVIEEYRPKFLKRQSIDAFIPQLAIAFEYDGARFHNSEMDKAKNDIMDEFCHLVRIREKNNTIILKKYKNISFYYCDDTDESLEKVLKEVIEKELHKHPHINIKRDKPKLMQYAIETSTFEKNCRACINYLKEGYCLLGLKNSFMYEGCRFGDWVNRTIDRVQHNRIDGDELKRLYEIGFIAELNRELDYSR